MKKDTTHSSKTITKADIIETIHEKVGLPKKTCIQIVERTLEAVKKELEKGQHVKLAGFGKFEVRSKKARKGRNPKTGEALEISARKVLLFRPSPILKDLILNANAQQEE